MESMAVGQWEEVKSNGESVKGCCSIAQITSVPFRSLPGDIQTSLIPQQAANTPAWKI